ncbi:MAG: phosphate acyltransferase [Woeseia sp.]
MTEPLERSSLQYHRAAPAGKLAIAATKPLANRLDLSQAYSPGVAYPSLKIKEDASQAAVYTTRGNLVAVISNGTAVLGLGAIGPLASKPVMEGKAVLFKRFAGIDVFGLEVDERDPDKLVEIIAPLEPTFGAINLEDIAAPECFEVEHKLRERMNIPVFHDDQHGTAIVAAAAVKNGLSLVRKKLEKVKLVSTGGGAAGFACLDLLVELGLRLKNGADFELVDPEDDPRYRDNWQFYHSLVCRKGVSVCAAQTVMRTNNTVIAACMVGLHQADAMICGTISRFDHHLQHIIEVIGPAAPDQRITSMSVLILPEGPLFIANAHIEVDPSAEHIVTPSASVKGIFNMSAIAVSDAWQKANLQ